MDEQHLRDATILVVDDNPTNLEVLSNYFIQYGYTILMKNSGEKALESLKRNIPDLILLDVVMPGIDGFETCRRLKEDTKTQDIPVIFMTALSDTSHKVKGFELGAVDYITKPFQREEVLVRVKTHLTLQVLKKNLQVKNQTLQVSLERERKMMEELRLSLSLSLPHELRTPLTVLLGYSGFLANPAKRLKPEQVIRYGTAIYKNSLRLYRLVENSLLYANLKLLKYTSKENVQWQSESLLNVTKMTTSLAQQHAKDVDRQNDLTLELIDAYVRVSPTNFEKIFTELLDNAFKYSQQGSSVSVKTGINGNLWILSITDKGRGMTKDQIAKIGAYMQFDRGRYEQQGMGLGLIIAQLLAQLEGGMLSIKSELNQGTTVSLVLNSEEPEKEQPPIDRDSYWFDRTLLPISTCLEQTTGIEKEIQGYCPLSTVPSEASREARHDPNFRQIKVLVVDSTWSNGEMVTQLLAPLGFEVFEAFDEFDGINKIVKYSPDLIFLDTASCEIESVKVMYQVQRTEDSIPIKILAITDAQANADQTNHWEACCDAVLEKPLHAQEVFEKLQTHLPLRWVYKEE
jgi:two-component system sensor histidine kinase/response regulator